MKIQPKSLCNVHKDDLDRIEVLQCALHCCQCTDASEPEQDAVPSCIPWLWNCSKRNRQQRGSIRSVVRAEFALRSRQGCVQCKCSVPLSQAGGAATVTWRAADNSGSCTWLSPKGTWTATKLQDCSLLLTDNSSTAQFEVSEPGAGLGETDSRREWLQLFLHDGGAAVLALGHNEQDGVVMYLWRQIRGASIQQHQQYNPWLQLPALPVSSSSAQGMPQATAASRTHAVFVQQQLGGLQLYVAHTVTHSTGAVLLCVLQQAVLDVSLGVPKQQQDGKQTGRSWHCMLISLPGATARNTLQQTLEPEQQQQQTWRLTGQLELTDVPATAPEGSAAVTAAAVKELLTKSSRSIASVKLSWHPRGSHLAVAVSAEGGSWVLVCSQGCGEVQECCWNHLLDKKTASLLHRGPCHISSMAWLSADSDVLAVIDTHGRLCLLSGGAFERLQLVDTAGMTITFKPVIQLHFSMLLAATSSSQTTAAALTHHFQLATVPTEASAESGSQGGLYQLAIWNGTQLLVCSLYPGVDPSQRRINQTVNSRTLLLYGTTSALRLATHHKRHQPENEEKGRKLGVRQPETVGGRGAAGALISGRPTDNSPATSSEGAAVEFVAGGVSVVFSPLMDSQACSMRLQQDVHPADAPNAIAAIGPQQQHPGQQQARLQQLMCDGDAAFVAGRWQECERIYRQGLPLTAGHIMAVLFCQYRVQEGLGLLQQLLADTMQAIAAQQAVAQSSFAMVGPENDAAVGTADSPTAAADEVVSAGCLPDLRPLQLLHLGMQLAATLSGLTADVLLAAVSGTAGSAAAAGVRSPCIFPTPLHWSKWVKQHTSEQGIMDPCRWQLTGGMVVELVAESVLADLSKQIRPSKLDSATSLHQQTAQYAAARAAGLLLLSEVVAAEAEGVPLPQDLPHLLTEAIATTQLPVDTATADAADASAAVTEPAGSSGMWQEAAVLAVSCGTVLQQVHIHAHMAELFDEAARFGLWRRLALHQLKPVPVLAQQAVTVMATAASIWPAGHPSPRQLTSQVLGLLCKCMALRSMSLPVLPPPTAAAHNSWSSLQQAVVQLLLTQALPAAMPSAVAAWQASGAADQLGILQHSTAGDKETYCNAYTAAAGALWCNAGVQQLLQLLGALCLQADRFKQEFGPGPFGAKLAAAGAALTAEAWAPHLHQYLIAAGIAGQLPQQQQQQEAVVLPPAALAELSCQCDLLILSSAVLLVAQVALGLSSSDLVDRMKQQWGQLAAEAATPSRSRWQLSGQGRFEADPAEEVGPDQAFTFISNIAWLMQCRQQVAAGPPEAVAGWVVCLSAADGLHKQHQVQQVLLAALTAADCQVTQQELQQLQEVLDGCCGGVLPRTADQLNKLKLAYQADTQHQQYLDKRVEFLQQLESMTSATEPRAASQIATSSGCCLLGALEVVNKQGSRYMQSCRQAVPGLQACLVHPLADGPEPSATSAYLALTALLLGSGASSSGSKTGGLPHTTAAAAAAAPGLEGDKKSAAGDEVMTSSVQISVLADGDDEAATATSSAAPEAAASLRTAAAAWQQEHIAVLQDQHLMQDVRQALRGPKRWSIGSFFSGLGSSRPGRLSLMQSMNLNEFSDFLLPSDSFSATHQQHASAAASAEGNAATSSRLSGATADSRLSGTSLVAVGAARQLMSPRDIMSPRRSLHQWNNPLATLELPSLESFYGVYSPTGSGLLSAPGSPSKPPATGLGLSPGQSQLSPGRLSFTASQPSQVQGAVSAAAGTSAPGSLSSSRLASPRSVMAPDGAAVAAAAGQLSTSTSFMQHYSPLQHYQSLRQQRLLPSQPSRVFRARSLSRGHSGEIWERRSSIGGAIDAIAARPSVHVPGELPTVATWGSVEPSGLLHTQLSEGSEMTGYDSPVAASSGDAAVPAAASAASAAELPVSAVPSQVAGQELVRSRGSSMLLSPRSACEPIQEHGLDPVPAVHTEHETQPVPPVATVAVSPSSSHSEAIDETPSSLPTKQRLKQEQQQRHGMQQVPVSTAARAKLSSTHSATRGMGDHSASTSRAAAVMGSPKAGPASYSTSPRAVKVARNTNSPSTARPHSSADSSRGSQPQSQQPHRSEAGARLRTSQPGHAVIRREGQQQQQHEVHQMTHHAQQQPRPESPAAAEKQAVPSSPSGLPGRRATGYVAQHAAHSKSRHSRPVGEAVEQREGLQSRQLGAQLQMHAPAVCGPCSSSNGSGKQLSLGKRWLMRLRRACRWPGSEYHSSHPGFVRFMAGPVAEGVEAAAGLASISQCSSSTSGPAAPSVTGPATHSAVEAVALEPAADVHCGSSSSLEPRAQEASPERLSAVQQQHLDDLLKAHLPEFISVLTRGLSPVQESSYVGSSGPSPRSQLGVQPGALPTLSLQRSFSMIELHDGAASSPAAASAAAGPSKFRASAEDVIGLLKSQAAELSQYSSSGCVSSGSVTVQQQQQRPAPFDQLEVSSAGPLQHGESAMPASLQVAVAARVHIPGLAAAHGLATHTPLLLEAPLGTATAGLDGLPHYLSTIRGPIPVAEAVESDASDNMPNSPGSHGSSSWTAAQLIEQQQEEGPNLHKPTELQRAAGGSCRRSASFENIPSMMERVRQLMTSLQTRAEATQGQEMGTSNPGLDQSDMPLDLAAAAAAEQYLKALEHGGGVDAVSNAATAAVEELSELDMSDFMGCYSPADKSRHVSRATSTAGAAGSDSSTPRHTSSSANNSQRLLAAAAAVGAMSHNPLVGAAAERLIAGSSYSRQSAEDAPDLQEFWVDSGMYSGAGTRVNSRQVSAHATPQQRRSTAEAAAPVKLPLAASAQVMGATRIAVPADSAAAASDSAPSGAGASAAGSQHINSPGSSQKAILLHGPSRLSLQTTVPADQGEGTVQQTMQAMQPLQQQDKPAVAARSLPGAVDNMSTLHGPVITRQPASEPAALNAGSVHQLHALMHTAVIAADSTTASEVSLQQRQEQQPADLLEAAQSLQPGTGHREQQTEVEQQQQQGPTEPKKKGSLKRMLFSKLGKSHDGDSRASSESGSIARQQQTETQLTSTEPAPKQPQQTASVHKRGFFSVFGRSTSHSGSGAVSQSGSPQQQQVDLQAAAQKLQQQKSPPGKLSPKMFAMFQHTEGSSPSRAGPQHKAHAAAAASAVSDMGSELGDVSMICQVASCPASPLTGSAGVDDRSPCQISLDGGVPQPQQQQQDGAHSPANTVPPAALSISNPAQVAAHTFDNGKHTATETRWQQHPQHTQQQHRILHATAAVANSPVLPAAAASVPPPAATAVIAPGSPVVEVLANSMQRIATALEEFLCEHSPARLTTPGSAGSKAIGRSPLGSHSVGRSPLRPTSAIQEEQSADGGSAATPLQRRSAPVGQQLAATWSPAAMAAKARMLGSTAANKAPRTQVQQQTHQCDAARTQMEQISAEGGEPRTAVAADNGGAAAVVQQAELRKSGTGWLHPDQFEMGLTQPTGIQRQHAEADVAQQQQEDNAEFPAGDRAAGDGTEHRASDTTTSVAGVASLDSFVLLASRAVGAEFLLHSLQPDKPVAGAQQQAGEQHTLQEPQQPEHGGLDTAHRAHLQAAVSISKPAEASTAPVPGHTAASGRPDLSSSPLMRCSWQHSASVSPTGLQHPRLWRPANLKVHRTRVRTPDAAVAAARAAPSSAQDGASLQQQQQQQPNAGYSSEFAGFCDISAAALHAGPPSGRLPGPSMGSRYPVGEKADTAATDDTGAAKCFLATADMKLIHRGMEHSIRLLRPTHLQEKLQGSPQHTQQHRSSAAVQHSPHPQPRVPVRNEAAATDFSFQHSRPAASIGYQTSTREPLCGPKLVRFPVMVVEANPLQPPVLQQPHSVGSWPLCRDQQAREPVFQEAGSLGPQQQQRMLFNAPLLQQHLPQQRQHSRAPWEMAGGAQGIIGPSAAVAEGTLTAGTRAARLLNTLLRPTGQPSAAHVATVAAQRLDATALQQQQQQHIVTGDGQVAIHPPGPAHEGTASEGMWPFSSSGSVVPVQSARNAKQQQLHRSPARSPRKGVGLHKKWVALQQLKARNRSRKQPISTVGRQGVQQQQQAADASTPADRLVEQLQQLMQQPAAVGGTADVPEPTYVQLGSYQRRYLDAAAATALQRAAADQKATQQQQQQPQQQQRNEPPGLEDSISFGKLGAGPTGPGEPGTTAPVQTEVPVQQHQQEQQPLLLPRMLSRAPLVDAEVQAGPLLQQQQQLAVDAGGDATTAALLAEVQKLVQLQRQPAVGTTAPGAAGPSEQAHPDASKKQQQHQQPPYVPQPPVSPASLVALAAAAGAGAAAAVHTASPRRTEVAAAGQAGAPASSPAPAAADQQPKQEKTATELARLILSAFETAGGFIAPDKDALGGLSHKVSNATAASARPHSQQQQQQWGLLVNPLAGPAAPQYLSVVDYTPPFPENSAADLQQDQLQQHDQQVYADEQLQAQQQYNLMSFSTDAQPHHGCCFAACPERIPSPSFRGPPTITRKISPPKGQRSQQRSQPWGASSSNSRSQFKQAQVLVTTSSKKVSGVAGRRSAQKQQTSSSKRAEGDTRSHRHHHHHSCKRQHEQQNGPFGGYQQQQQQQHFGVVAGVGASSSIGVLSPPLSRRTSSKLQELRQSRLSLLQQQQQPQQQGHSDWASQQTRQLAHLWQQWHDLQGQQQRDQQQQSQRQPIDENSDPHGAQACTPMSGRQQQHAQQKQQLGGIATALSAINSGADAPPSVYLAERYTEPKSAPAAVAAEAARAPVCTDAATAEQDVCAQERVKQPVSEECLQVEAAYSRAAAAHAAAKAAAQRAAAARSQRLRAELTDLSKMLSEVDNLAAQMEAEAAEAAAAVEQYAFGMGGSASTSKLVH